MNREITRRKVISSTAISALAVASAGQVSGQTTPSGESETRTLTLENDGDADSVRYQLSWGSPGSASVDSGEFTSETAIEIGGDLLRFAAVGVDAQADLTITLDGEEVDPKNLVESHTLTIDAADDSYREYELAVESDLEKSDVLGSVQENDNVEGTSATGSIAGGLDSYTYTGSLERFQGEDVTVYIDGVVRDPMELVSTHTLTIERGPSPTLDEEGDSETPMLRRPFNSFSTDEPRSYELAVESDLEKSDALNASLNDNDTVDGTTAAGIVGGGRDSYTYTGSLERLQGEGVAVFIDGQRRDPFDLVETHTLSVELDTFDDEEGDPFPRRYTLAVEGDLEKSDALSASLNDNDTVDGTSASGKVAGGRDSYTYSGSLRRFTFDDFGSFSGESNTRVIVDGQIRDLTDLVDTHTLTISSDRLEEPAPDEEDTPVDYTLSVPADLEKSDALGASVDDGDVVDGTTATGTVTSGLDSYTYTGDSFELSGASEGEEPSPIGVVLDGRAAVVGYPYGEEVPEAR